MSVLAEAIQGLQEIPHLTLLRNEPLSRYTRFGIGGPAAVLGQSASIDSFTQALVLSKRLGVPTLVIAGGSNLIVSDDGYAGVVLRFTGSRTSVKGTVLTAEAGAVLQDVVDRSIAFGLQGLETMTGIPGHLGGAVYGNAGAYGHSIDEIIETVTFTDGEGLRTFTKAECQFRYRESIFKAHKDWIVLSANLAMTAGEPAELRRIADEIRRVRDAKYPPDMRCAGSIFKNIFLADLPPAVQAQVPPQLVRDGKVPSAWFLEQSGVKGLRRGDIQVASYHANLIYNDGQGTAADLLAVIREVKDRVEARFGFSPEEEVQYVGFE